MYLFINFRISLFSNINSHLLGNSSPLGSEVVDGSLLFVYQCATQAEVVVDLVLERLDLLVYGQDLVLQRLWVDLLLRLRNGLLGGNLHLIELLGNLMHLLMHGWRLAFLRMEALILLRLHLRWCKVLLVLGHLVLLGWYRWAEEVVARRRRMRSWLLLLWLVAGWHRVGNVVLNLSLYLIRIVAHVVVALSLSLAHGVCILLSIHKSPHLLWWLTKLVAMALHWLLVLIHLLHLLLLGVLHLLLHLVHLLRWLLHLISWLRTIVLLLVGVVLARVVFLGLRSFQCPRFNYVISALYKLVLEVSQNGISALLDDWPANRSEAVSFHCEELDVLVESQEVGKLVDIVVDESKLDKTGQEVDQRNGYLPDLVLSNINDFELFKCLAAKLS